MLSASDDVTAAVHRDAVRDDWSAAEGAPALAVARNFTEELAKLLRKEHGAFVDFLLALAEFDGRRLWVTLGYASLFDFLHRKLGLSRSAAYYRSAAAALVQRHPEVIEPLADGRLCVTSLAQIARVISRENVDEILPRFFHRSSREAKEIAAEIAPVAAPPIRDVVTRLSARNELWTGSAAGSFSLFRTAPHSPASPATPTITSFADPVIASAAAPDFSQDVHALGLGHEHEPAEDALLRRVDADAPAVGTITASPSFQTSPTASTRREDSGNDRKERENRATAVEPLSGELRRIHITVSRRWIQKLEQARAALSHSIPSGSAELILEAALDALLERVVARQRVVAKRRASKSRRDPTRERAEEAPTSAPADEPIPPSADPPESNPAAAAVSGSAVAPVSNTRVASLCRRETIPAQVRRAVMERDQGRCQAKLHDGEICGSTVRLELDHIQPMALGGPSTVENLRVVCRQHNQLAARQIFGEAWMDHVSSSPPASPAGPGPRPATTVASPRRNPGAATRPARRHTSRSR